MSDFPPSGGLTPSATISTLSMFANGHLGPAVGGTVWPAVNLAMFIPIRVPVPLLVRQLAVANGVLPTGNTDVGLYDEHGVRLVSTGSVATSGSSVVQVFDVTDTWIGPGVFYLALVRDDVNGDVQAVQLSNAARLEQLGVAEMGAAMPLPATATFATPASTIYPMMAAVLKTVV